MKQSSVEWLAEKYNYVFWLRNRDEISSQQGDEYRSKYLQIAKEMHKDEIIDAFRYGNSNKILGKKHAEQYYNETFNNK